MLQRFRHHLIQSIRRIRRIQRISLTDHIPVHGANTVTEHIHLKLFYGGEAFAIAIGLRDGQRCVVGIFVDKIVQGIEPGGSQRILKNRQIFLSVFEEMITKIPVIAAPFRRNVVIQKVLVIGIHHIIFIFELAVKGRAADGRFFHDHFY